VLLIVKDSLSPIWRYLAFRSPPEDSGYSRTNKSSGLPHDSHTRPQMVLEYSPGCRRRRPLQQHRLPCHMPVTDLSLPRRPKAHGTGVRRRMARALQSK